MTRTALPLLLAALCGGALAAPSHDDQCRALARQPYPEEHRAPPSGQAGLAGCRAVALYYGSDAAPDPVRARPCALAAPADDQPFREDRGVLMMIYANGLGVPRDYTLARKAACEAGGAPAEIEGRLAHLDEMEAGRAGPAPSIDICDDITSGYMGGWCAALASERAERRRGADFARLVAPWSAREKQALAALEPRARDFIARRGTEEVDLSGTLRAAFTIREEERQLADFRAALAGFERGALPREAGADAEYARLDARLNAVYHRIRDLPASEFTTIRFAGIQQTQRAWLAYREAWVAFGKVKYPQVPANAWRAWLTRKRIAMLKALEKQLR
ncbi:MAG: lysozyme inhibitor LprI family protein [Janthinobacterium lividum]